MLGALLSLTLTARGVAQSASGDGDTADLRAQVTLMLSRFEAPEDPRAAWRDFPLAAVDVLHEIANAEDRSGFMRAGALSAMGWFDDPHAENVLASFALDANAGALAGVAAIALAQQGRAGGLAVLRTMIDRPGDAWLQAVEALGYCADDAAGVELSTQLATRRAALTGSLAAREQAIASGDAALATEHATRAHEIECEMLALWQARAQWARKRAALAAGASPTLAVTITQQGERAEEVAVEIVPASTDVAGANSAADETIVVRLIDTGGFTQSTLDAARAAAQAFAGVDATPARLTWSLERRGEARDVWAAFEVVAIGTSAAASGNGSATERIVACGVGHFFRKTQ